MRLQDIILYNILLIVSIGQGFSQKSEEDLWHKGYLVFENKDTLEGLVNFDFRNNFVQYQKGDDYRILLPGKFTDLHYTGSLDSVTHDLKVFEVKTSEDYYRPYFFEIIDTLSKIKLVKQYYWIQRASSFGQFGGFEIYYEKIVNLYLIDNNQKAIYLKLSKRNILEVMKDKKELIKQEVIDKRWRYTKYGDVIKIIQFYNSKF